jgi:hypothetical protein
VTFCFRPTIPAIFFITSISNRTVPAAVPSKLTNRRLTKEGGSRWVLKPFLYIQSAFDLKLYHNELQKNRTVYLLEEASYALFLVPSAAADPEDHRMRSRQKTTRPRPTIAQIRKEKSIHLSPLETPLRALRTSLIPSISISLFPSL